MVLKVVFIASLNSISASGRQRLWALETSGADVTVVNMDEFISPLGKFSSVLAKVLGMPSLLKKTKKLEEEILRKCTDVSPSIVWFEWPRELGELFIIELKKTFANSFFISFQDDNPWGARSKDRWIWKNYFKIIPLFDLHLVKRESDVKNLTYHGAKKCRFWLHGVYSPLFHPISNKEEFIKYPVSFVGTCMDNRVELVQYLLENGVNIHVFGTQWRKRCNLPERYPNNFHDQVRGEDYSNVIRSSQICIGLVSHSNYDEWTMRSFEVPGCERLLLAEKTTTHEVLFKDGEEIILFSSKEECLVKINFLLENPLLCKEIGKNAFKKCVQSNFFLEERMRELLNYLRLNKLI